MSPKGAGHQRLLPLSGELLPRRQFCFGQYAVADASCTLAYLLVDTYTTTSAHVGAKMNLHCDCCR